MVKITQPTLSLSAQLFHTVNANASQSDYGPLNFKGIFGQQPTPFQIDVNPSFVAETQLKAKLTRPAIDLDEPDFTTGVPSHNITAISDYWANHYDWFAVQTKLNAEFQHFTISIPPVNGSAFNESIPLHFVHHRSPRADAIPLLFIHGWPGSFLEVSNIMPDLLNPSSPTDPAFHVVAPSLPGFGFSPAPTKPGLGLVETGTAFNELMKLLGYKRYVIQGGDFGSHTARYMGAAHPESVVSILSNLYNVSPNATDISRRAANQTTAEENAYFTLLDTMEPFYKAFWNIESMIPLQVGILLTDNPIGNIAWSYYGMRMMAPGYRWTIEELITWSMMLYIQGPYGSIRMYRELQREGTLDFNFPYVSVPVGVLEYFGDAAYGAPRDWCERSGNITYFVKKSINTMGGHFPAHVNPKDLVQEIRNFWGSSAGGWS